MIFRADIATGVFCLDECPRAAAAGAGAREFESARNALAGD